MACMYTNNLIQSLYNAASGTPLGTFKTNIIISDAPVAIGIFKYDYDLDSPYLECIQSVIDASGVRFELVKAYGDTPVIPIRTLIT